MRRKVLICGSRDWHDGEAIWSALWKLPANTLVITGGADGADRLAATNAKRCGLFVAEVECHRWHWDRFEKRAGYFRNCAMLDLEPDLVIAFTTGSSGTQLTIDEARNRGIPVEVHGTERAS